MRALVLGGAGFIGVATCRELMRRGVETIAAGRTPQPYGTFTSYRAVDRRDPSQLERFLAEVQPDVLCDLACYQAAEMESVLRLFRGTRYVFVSTGVYPPGLEGRPAREDDFRPLEGEPPGEPVEYFEGKRWCETLLARRPDFPWIVIRPPAVFGAGDPSLRVAAYLQRLEDGGPLLVPEETYRRQAGLAWVKDIGYACALACTQDPLPGRAYNAAFSGVSLEDLIKGMARAMNREAALVPVPFAQLPPGASPYGPNPERWAGYDLERARSELGFEPSALEDALAETLAWYRVARPSHPGYSSRPEELALAHRLGQG
jgi:2'-hydroxyisoflavone reductase